MNHPYKPKATIRGNRRLIWEILRVKKGIESVDKTDLKTLRHMCNSNIEKIS